MKIKRGLTNTLAFARAASREKDAGNWSKAAALYADFLRLFGRNALTFRYVVQLGNCLKEAGQYEEALAAYDDAVRISGRNADLHLQRGHLFKLMGNTPASAWAYQRAYNLDPGNQNACFEIEQSGAPAVSGVELPDGDAVVHTLWFDVTDFVDYARENVTLSGIQRVCGNLMLGVAALRLKGYRVAAVLPDYETGDVHSVHYDSLVRLIGLFGEATVDPDQILRGVAAVEATKSAVLPGVGDILAIAGAFWIVRRYDKVAALRRRGVRFGLFIHDLILIRNPDLVMPDAVDSFAIRLSDAMELCDVVLTSSQYVRDDVRRYLRETKHRDVPVHDIRLPTEVPVKLSRGSRTDSEASDLQSLRSHDYVLIVSTIEVRKNHALLIRVWEQLREELGDRTPHLVFVGKWGWQVDALHAYIEERGYEGDWLLILNGVSDVVMGSLYRGALFTVYPSFAEGFGLPIGESLAYGTPCIASGTTAMPEAGGDFVRYVDPYDWTSALPVIRQPIIDRDDLRHWRERIGAEFHPRPWTDFCGEFYRTLIACAEAAPDHAIASLPLLPPCHLIVGGDTDILIAAARNWPIITFRAAQARNWRANETWGVWSSGPRCEIAFRTNLEEGERVDLFLRLHRAGSSDSDFIVIAGCGAGETSIALGVRPTFHRFVGSVKKHGEIRIYLSAQGMLPPVDLGSPCLALSGLAYCRHGNGEDVGATISHMLPAVPSLSAKPAVEVFGVLLGSGGEPGGGHALPSS